MKRTMIQCPCCSLPTLSERAGFEICTVCWWEDDGQDDDDADKVLGGPNSLYSLSDARENFLDHYDMYASGEGNDTVEKPTKARRELLEFLGTFTYTFEHMDLEKFYLLLERADRLTNR